MLCPGSIVIEQTNRNSVSMQDMAEATTQAASMASELGVQENQTFCDDWNN